MRHHTDRIVHTTIFITPVVEHWLKHVVVVCCLFVLFFVFFASVFVMMFVCLFVVVLGMLFCLLFFAGFVCVCVITWYIHFKRY